MCIKKEILKSELITIKNFKEALAIQNVIFPRENARVNFLESFAESKIAGSHNEFVKEYFLVRNDAGKAVGIWGHYLVDDNRDELWLGWYGVIPTERRKGYGTEIFRHFERYAKDKNFKIIRLYTDDIDNANACKLYEKMGMTKEYYNNKDDITEDIGKIVIYSKSLTGGKVKLWNNKSINYREQRQKEI